MKAQTRRGTAMEIAVNLLAGFAISWAVNRWVLPFFGYTPPPSALFTLGAVMTLASIVRQYILRRVFERLRIRTAPPEFLYIAEELAAERRRQISGEGYNLAHDDQYTRGELQRAAAWYALSSTDHSPAPEIADCLEVAGHPFITHPAYGWPWDPIHWKPTSERRDLVKAGALIIAAIGRHDRAARGTP